MRNLTQEECLFAVKEAQKPNKTFSTIAHQLHCDRRTICRVVSRFNETGLLAEQEKPGRPTSLSEGQQRSLDTYRLIPLFLIVLYSLLCLCENIRSFLF